MGQVPGGTLCGRYRCYMTQSRAQEARVQEGRCGSFTTVLKYVWVKAERGPQRGRFASDRSPTLLH